MCSLPSLCAKCRDPSDLNLVNGYELSAKVNVVVLRSEPIH
jgi:hypothetical protein